MTKVKTIQTFILLAGLCLTFTSTVFAQGATTKSTKAPAKCQNATINSAFSQAVSPSRAPFMTQAEANAAGFTTMYVPNGECDAGRYAGGAFSTVADLVPLVKASLVCQDPWIAQGYYKLHLQINGHDPTVLENGRPASTQGQCNISTYVYQGRQDGWNDFNGLLAAISRHLSAAAAPVAPPSAGAKVTIANPFGETLPIVANQPMVIRWSYTGNTTCAQGVHFLLNNAVWGGNIPLSAGTATIDVRYTNFAYPLETRVPLVLADACTQQVISPPITARITSASGVLSPGLTITVLGQPVVINPRGALVTVDGQILAEDLRIIPDPNHHYYININKFLMVANLVSTNGGNVVAQGAGNVVAQGAGNVVAQGAGNVVGPGGGSVVAAGAGNIILQSAPDRTATSVLTAGYLTDIWGEHILHAGSKLSFRNGVLIGADGRAIVSHDGGTIITEGGAGLIGQDGAGLKVISLNSTQLQQVLTGATTINAIMNPNLGSGQIMNPNLGAGQIMNPNLGAGQIIRPNTGSTQIIGMNASGVQPQAQLLTSGGSSVTAVNGNTLISIDHSKGLALRTVQSVSSYTIRTFAPASTAWPNKTAATFQWTLSGAPGAATAIVQMQLAGGIYDVCAPTPVSQGRCQTQIVDWTPVMNAPSGAAFSLVENGTWKVLANFASAFTVKVP